MPRLITLLLTLSMMQATAAASLTDALKEIGTNFEKESGIHPVFNFGASSLLERQIVEGAPADSRLTTKEEGDLRGADFRKIALADPQAVPAGIYARKFLEQVHLADELRTKIVPVENVRAALAAVEAGNADAAFVYKADAAISQKVRVIFSVPPGEAPIRYPVAIMRETKEREAASSFVKYLESSAARDVFTRYGFVVQP